MSLRRAACFHLLLLGLFPSIRAQVGVSGNTAGTAEFDLATLSNQEILLKLFDFSGGFRWNNHDQWLQTPDVCEFFGVQCYNSSSTTDQRRIGHVQALNLADNHLVGTLPPEVYSLPYLETIDVRDNDNLHIEFSNIGAAQFLRTLEISQTSVSSLAGLEKATGIERLHLTNLNLAVTFPTEILGLSNLKGLLANFNQFSGTLPSEIGNLLHLEELFLYENQLDGEIPVALGNLSLLKTLSLAQNSFTGTIPIQLNQCSSLEILALQRSPGATSKGLSGSLPAFDNLGSLTELYIQNQEITGEIPTGFLQSTSSAKVVTVDLSKNRLTGGIPTSLLQKNRLRLLLAGNMLSFDPTVCDSLPQTWMGGDVGILGCDAFLCAPGFSAPIGRSTESESCSTCNGAQYWGTFGCSAAPGEAVPLQEERSILVEFFNQMGGPYWKHTDEWLNPGVPPCSWYGIECENGSVTAIRIRNNDLTSASLSTQRIFQLPNLKVLDLSSNSIDFSFNGIELAVSLEELDVSHSDLTSLEGLSGLRSTNIRRLSIASNRLAGGLPVSLYQLTTLQELDLSHNRFLGPLSSSISQLTNLRRLRLFGNRLNGSLPPQVGFLPELLELNAAENDFSGDLPDTLNSLTKLEMLILHQSSSQSSFTGGLPVLDNLAQLTSLHLEGNAIGGPLPPDILLRTNRGNDLIDIGLTNNALTGTVPSSWALRFSHLSLDLTDNQITALGSGVCDQEDWMGGSVGSYGCDAVLCPVGTFNDLGRQTGSASPCLPCGQSLYMGSKACGLQDEIGGTNENEIDILQDFYANTHGLTWANSSGWTVTADFCSWYGIQCNAAGKVIQLRLEDNNVTGLIPNSIFRLRSLRVLSIQKNAISFSFSGIEEASSLTTLDLSSTGLNSIAGLGKAVGLTELHVSDNDLTGVFPTELLRLQGLRYLYCNANAIGGRLPSEIRTLSNLESLYLFGNRFSGQIPASIGSLTGLRELVLAENNFDGTLPLELNDLTNLERLSIQREGGVDDSDVGKGDGSTRGEGSGITGPLLAFESLPKLSALFLGSNSLSGVIPDNFLDGISDKSKEVLVDLFHNDLVGSLPASLARFDAMTVYLSGNKIDNIPNGVCRKTGWMGGSVATYGCDAILCAPNSYSSFGRHADDSSPCQQCSDAESAAFYGSLGCSSEAEQALSNERSILEELHRSCNGDSWFIQDGWMDDDVPVCQWHGISCGSNGSVRSVHLTRNGLLGQVPISLFSLQGLTELNLASNTVRFSFLGIASASNLEYLSLSDTGLESLSGLQQATNIRTLYAESNRLEGWPNEIFSLPNLEVLYLSRNKISRSLPDTIGELSELTTFVCDDCRLNGTLPVSLGALGKLSYLSLKHNALTGRLPQELESLLLLKSIDLSKQISSVSDGISGPLLSFQNSSLLTTLNFEENQITGFIPESILSAVEASSELKINLGGNRLTGTLPSGLSRFANVEIDIRDNNIQQLASGFCSLGWNNAQTSGCEFVACPAGTFNGLGRATSTLSCEVCPNVADAPYSGSTSCGEDLEREILENMFLVLSGQRWTRAAGWGTQEHICTWQGIACYEGGIRDGSVRAIDLSDNNVAGTISEQIWLLTHLEFLDLSKNDVDLSLATVGNANSLKHLILSETRVKSISGFAQANSLVTLELGSLGLEGTFPEEILSLTNLQRVVLQNNKLTGTIPTFFLSLYQMKELFLDSNEFSGGLDNGLALMRDIRVLSLGKNKWTGTVPTLLGTLTDLEVLALDKIEQPIVGNAIFQVQDSGLTGALPTFDRAPRIRDINFEHQSLGGTIPANFLDQANRTEPIKVNLEHNGMHGVVPETLASFGDLRLLLAGNRIEVVPPAICEKTDWMEGQLEFGCDSFLCPPNTFNTFGRRVPTQECLPCDFRGSSLFYGSTACGEALPHLWTAEEILTEVYNSTGGEGWTDNTNWLQSAVAYCEWFGVTCESGEGDNVITAIELPQNNMLGNIPSHIFFLPELRILNVGSNAISIDLRGAAESDSLVELYIDSTNVSSIHGLSQSTNLRVLKMDNTNFHGKQLPDDLFSLTQLRLLDLARCGFTGTVPTRIGSLVSLESLVMSHNDLSGTISQGMAALTSLESLVLSENNFFGNLDVLSKLPALRTLALSAREHTFAGISGPLLSFASSPKIRSLDLGGNSITGTIPDSFLSNIDTPTDSVRVLLDDNLLHGVIPAALGERFELLTIDLSDNEINGVGDGLCLKGSWQGGDVGKFSCDGLICPPGTFSDAGRKTSEANCQSCPGQEDSPFFGQSSCPQLTKLTTKSILDVIYESTNGPTWINNEKWASNSDICEWYGITCSANDGTVESITLGSNNLIGSIPTAIYEIEGLQSLWLYSNPVSVSFEGIDKAKTLQSLQLDSTGLSSLTGIGKATALKDIDIRFNKLSEALPTELEGLTNLVSLFCDGNRLNGEIPSFERNRKLAVLRMSDNDFTGSLPSFATHPDMSTLDVSQNDLAGVIPPDLFAAADAETPVFVDLSDNSFEGTVPASLSRFKDATFFARDNFLVGVHPDLCMNDRWNNGDVGLFGCDGILCPPNTGATLGRATTEDGGCRACGQSLYFGSSCEGGTSDATRLPLAYTPAICILLFLFFY